MNLKSYYYTDSGISRCQRSSGCPTSPPPALGPPGSRDSLPQASASGSHGYFICPFDWKWSCPGWVFSLNSCFYWFSYLAFPVGPHCCGVSICGVGLRVIAGQTFLVLGCLWGVDLSRWGCWGAGVLVEAAPGIVWGMAVVFPGFGLSISPFLLGRVGVFFPSSVDWRLLLLVSLRRSSSSLPGKLWPSTSNTPKSYLVEITSLTVAVYLATSDPSFGGG